MSLLGVDVGTTGCKAVAFDLDGKLLAKAYREYPLVSPRPGWFELDAHNLWQSVAQVIRETNSQLGADPAEALSVSCQGEAVAPIDTSGAPLCDFSVTFDHRTIEQAKWWEKSLGAQKIFSITGMPLHEMYTINKIMWLRDNCPDIVDKTVKFLCVEDYVNFRLTGQSATDWTLAARTMAFDVVDKCWSKKILDMADISPIRLPRPCPSGTAVGTVTAAIAEDLGFGKHVLVATGGHDQPCGALGAGVVRPGVSMYATGTVDCICAVLEKPMLGPDMLAGNYCCYSHVNPDQYVTLAFSFTGGLLLRWYRDVFCDREKQIAENEGKDPYDVIIDNANTEIRSLFFLPHFTGSGTPYLDGHSRGALVGLTVDTTKEDISRAVLDSTAYETKLNIERLHDVGCNISELRAIGGGAKSERWLQIKADCFGLPVSSMAVSEAASLGAAMLAGIAIGRFKNAHDAVDAMVKPVKTFEPQQTRTQQYQEKFQQYKEIYPSLKTFNHLITKNQ